MTSEFTTDTIGPVRGDNMGSVSIDNSFTEWLLRELAAVGCDYTDDTFCQEAAENNRYVQELHKAKLALDNGLKQFHITVRGLAEGATALSKDGWFAEQDRMNVPVKILQLLFDWQIEAVHKQVYACIREMSQKAKTRAGQASRDEASHVLLDTILLSGGLGGSRYFAEKLRQRLEADRESKALKNIPNLKFCISKEPQVCVCHGLVIDRLQQLDRTQQLGSPFRRHVFFWEKKNCYRYNYGVAIQSIANPSGGDGTSKDMIWTVVWFAKKVRELSSPRTPVECLPRMIS